MRGNSKQGRDRRRSAWGRVRLFVSSFDTLRARGQVQHANIVPLLGWSQDDPAPCLVYALMEGGSLQDRLECERGTPPLTIHERVTVLHDVAIGLAFLHRVGLFW